MYEVGKKFEAVVTLEKIAKYASYYGYRAETMLIYIMKDEEGNSLVWNTSGVLKVEKIDDDGFVDTIFPKENDKIRIKGTVKNFSQYKGKDQIEIQRTKMLELVEAAETKEQKENREKEEQLASLKDGDFIWTEMPYKQYKEHYSDCEKLAGSYKVIGGKSYVSVIIREGRLKASGTRGEHYVGYELTGEDGTKVTYRAICEENAVKRANKEIKQQRWECTHVYFYNQYHHWF